MAVQTRKTNKAFMLLSAIGIIFVIDAHLWNGMSFFSEIFPYDSFFMPMFIFVSGYFFKAHNVATIKSTVTFMWKKVKNLLLPYGCWVFFYFVLTTLLRHFNIITFGKLTLFEFIKNLIAYGATFGFNDAAWFVPVLFCVSIVYSFFRWCCKKFWNDWIATIVLILLGAGAVHLAKTEFNTAATVIFLKTAFFIQFFQLAILFREHLEEKFDHLNTVSVILVTVCINIILLIKYGEFNIIFPVCSSMSQFRTDNYFLPLITSITGTAFWLKISKVFAPVLGDNKLINFISDNTFFIMTHHLLYKSLFFAILSYIGKLGVETFNAIDVIALKNDPWYVFGSANWAKISGFIFTTVVTLLACKLYLTIKELALKKFPLLTKIKEKI